MDEIETVSNLDTALEKNEIYAQDGQKYEKKREILLKVTKHWKLIKTVQKILFKIEKAEVVDIWYLLQKSKEATRKIY